MILLYTDFATGSPYLGQLHALLASSVPAIERIELCSDAPSFRPQAAGILLSALLTPLPLDGVVLAVIDPGVGSTSRRPIVVECDGRWLVGPENGLFDRLVEESHNHRCWRIDWRPGHLSRTFHGRDLFAPVAARIAQSGLPGEWCTPTDYRDSPPLEGHQLIYVDGYGNLMTSIRCSEFSPGEALTLNGERLRWAETFSDVTVGTPFCYCNALGLVEIAVNQGSAAERFRVGPGTPLDRPS